MENWQVMITVLGGIAAFAVFWMVIVWFISLFSGWSKLADAYPSRIPFDETCWSMQSARFRWGSGYNGILRVCADSQALHISVFVLFRPGNRPFSVPWEDISAQRRPFGVELRFYRAEGVPMRISRSLAEHLVQAAQGRLSIDDA
jgi:hypothetical protein